MRPRVIVSSLLNEPFQGRAVGGWGSGIARLHWWAELACAGMAASDCEELLDGFGGEAGGEALGRRRLLGLVLDEPEQKDQFKVNLHV